MEPLLEGLLRSLGGSEANFLELCFGRFLYGNFHTKATSKKFRPPSGNFRLKPSELPRSPSMSFSSREAGWRTVLFLNYFHYDFGQTGYCLLGRLIFVHLPALEVYKNQSPTSWRFSTSAVSKSCAVPYGR